MYHHGFKSGQYVVLFAHQGFEAEPDGADEARDDGGQDDLECQALRLFNALAPFAKMDEIGPEFDPIFFLDPKRCQDRRDGFKHHLVNLIVVKAFLFSENFGNDLLDFNSLHSSIPIN